MSAVPVRPTTGAIGRVKDAHEAGEKISWSHISLRNEWNLVKDEVCVNRETGEIWWAQNSKWVYDSAIKDASVALANWKSSKHGKRKGKKVGFARFKTKKNPNRSCRFHGGVSLVGTRRIALPRIGQVRTHESTKKLARKLAQGGRMLGATLSRNSAGRWFLSIQVDCPDRIRCTSNAGGAVGVDLGLKKLAVVVDTYGQVRHVESNSRHLKAALAKLRRAQRKVSRREPESNRRELAKRQVAQLHVRVANLRSDQIHKFTTDIAKRFSVVIVEDLNVTGMVKNRRMARSVSDAAFGEIRRQLGYKCETVLVADRFFASSKTCSGCGAKKANLHLGIRTYECELCGLVIDRDVNAALNLARVALKDNVVGYTVSGRGLSIGPARGQLKVKRQGASPQPALVGSTHA